MEAAIITTYRCNSKCVMCNIWGSPTSKEEEFNPTILERLPKLSFCNITGGEPFVREDIEKIIKIVKKKARRTVISTNGYYTDRILEIAKRNKDIGIRISLEGLPEVNDSLRGIKNDFDHAIRTLLRLHELEMKDIGLATTISDANYGDLLDLYELAKSMRIEFATAAVHNSYYFHKYDNRLEKQKEVISELKRLIGKLLSSSRIKDWFRAYFNYGLIGYTMGNRRLLPCRAGSNSFFLDPLGEVRPCNGMEEKIWCESMGDLKEKTFQEIWYSEKAREVRKKVKDCPKNCWMIGTASPAIKSDILKPAFWIIKHKFLRFPV